MNKIELLKNVALKKFPEHKDRLDLEFKEIDKVSLWEYFIDLIDSRRKFHNENNLLCAHAWGICPENPIDKDLIWVESKEYPDLDIDFSPECRNLLKEYCTEKFGKDKVVSIVNYNTFGLKSGLRDIARIFEVPLEEVAFVKDIDDQDASKLPWEDLLNQYSKLKEFNEKYPEICKAYLKMNDRVRNIGRHAGGIIISSKSISDYVPLVCAKSDDEEDSTKMVMSSFSEGQKFSDLKTFGFLKQDILGLENLNYISGTLRLMKERGKYDPKIGIFRNHKDWDDESYLNDPKCMEVANTGDLQLIFQFDSASMRSMIKQGGVDSFDDLVAYTSLGRPGPRDCGMVDEYIKRKNKEVEFELHPLLAPIIGNTYGVICYQEQLMRVLNVAGLISLYDCDTARRAMGKKDEKKLLQFKDKFVENAQRTLSWNKDQCTDLWNQMQTFSNYGFNLCISPDSLVEFEDGTKKKAGDCRPGDKIKSYDGKDFVYDEVVKVHENGLQEIYETCFMNGKIIECTLNHEFVCTDNIKRRLKFIIENNLSIVTEDGNTEIRYALFRGKLNVIDLEMKSDRHNYVANGIVVGNSHAAAYTVVSARCLYLRTYYPHEYYAAVLSCLKTGDKRISIYIQDGKTRRNLQFLGVDINNSKLGYTLEDDFLRIGFNKIKGISKEAARLVSLQPFKSFEDYLNRFGYSKTVGQTLIKVGAFDCFYPNRNKLLSYWEYRRGLKDSKVGISLLKWRQIYKEITGRKCSAEDSERFKEICGFTTKIKSISFLDLIELIEDGRFDEIIDKEKLLKYLDDNKEVYDKKPLSYEEYENIEDFLPAEKAFYEKEYCGIYFKEPLDEYQRPVDTLVVDLLEGITDTVSAMIVDIQKKQAKNNNNYYVLTLRDETGEVKMTLWGNEYLQFEHLIFSGSCILVKLVRPKNDFWPWNLKKYSKIQRLRSKEEMTEIEELNIQYEKDFNNYIGVK